MSAAGALLSDAEREAFLDAFDRYFLFRAMIRNAGGRLGPFNKAERSTFTTYKDYINRTRANVERQHAIRMVREIRQVIHKASSFDISKHRPNWPMDVAELMKAMPGVAIECFCGVGCAAPPFDLCRGLSDSFSSLRDRVDRVYAELVGGPIVETASPVGRALLGSGGRVPAAQAKLPDLAQMQFGRALGANQAGSNETAYKVSIKIGEQPDHIGGVDVAFGVRAFQICLKCEAAVPSLAPGLKTLNFYREGEVRQAKVSDDFLVGSLLQDRIYRIEAREGPGVLVGHSDQETLFVVAGELRPGDKAVLETHAAQLPS